MAGPLSLFRRRAAMPEVWRIGTVDWPVVVTRRAGTRRVTLRLCPLTDSLRISAPPRVAVADLRDILDRHAATLATQAAKLPPRVPFAEGAVLPFRGGSLRIVRAEGFRNAWRDDADGPVLAVGGRPEHLARRVRDALIRRAETELKAETEAACARLARFRPRPLAAVKIGDARGRWGSCASDGTLRFSWRVILAPPEVLRYLVAHEAAHLAEMNHSPRFWEVVAALDPDFRTARAWLKRHGSQLHRVGPAIGSSP